MKPYLTLLIIFAFIFGCNPKRSENYTLTPDETKLCDSLKIDVAVIQEIRKHNSNKIEAFHYSLSKIVNQDGTLSEADPIYLNGLVFPEENSNSYELVFTLKDDLKKKGYTIFLLENNFNVNDQPDQIGVLKTTDKYDVLKQVATDGINYDIDNDSLISIVKQFDAKLSLELIGASGDWCEFVINNEPTDWLAFANDVYRVCPDIVDQGTGTVEAAAEEMRRTKRLYFWWD